ncbi:TRAP transporter small permease [Defluviimonas sp. SAOS-178_SWC]|uniref:TRAP transporter small permease n=1 Tax=Defluviimonas sp. SAOS-178_SWC TaxID=3121287 RepID=UPI003221CB63
MIFIMLIICTKVAMRYFFGTGIVGIDQISGTAMLYIAFLSAAWVLKKESHVTIDIVLAIIDATARRRMNVVASLLCAAVCLIITIFGALEVWQSWVREVRIASEIEILRAYNLAVIPLGCFLLFLQFLRRARGGVIEGSFGKEAG